MDKACITSEKMQYHGHTITDRNVGSLSRKSAGDETRQKIRIRKM